MNATLKTILKIAAAVVIPGAGIYFVLKTVAEAAQKQEFRNYIRKTYGKGSWYEHVERLKSDR
jgi:hypothetical protein